MKTVTVKEVCIQNDVGGTEILPKGKYLVQVAKSWHDYETGMRLIGRLVKEEDIEKARKAGTTGFKPEDYAQYGKEAAVKVARERKKFDPAKVYFSGFDIVKSV